MAGNQNLPTENINEVILGLLKIKSGSELDYQTYFNAIKKRLAAYRMVGGEIPYEEDQLLREELKRVGKLKDKGRFKVKKKKIKVASTGPGTGPSPAAGGGGASPPKSGAIVKAPFSGITKDFIQPPIQPVSVRDITDKKPGVKKDKTLDFLERINKTLGSILETLTNIGKQDADERERQRKESEKKKRSEKEKGLESKTFDGIKKVVSTLIKPFQSIWDRIVNFIVYTLLGRAFIKLIDWFGKKENQEKVQSIIRFFGDHWATLLALYLRFGTGLGRFIGRLGGVLIKGAFKLGALATKLLLKAGVGKAGGKLSKVAGFLGGPRGKAVAAGLGIAADVAVTAGTAFGIEKLMGGEQEKTPPAPPIQKFAGGGSVKYPKFSGGGFNFKGLMSGASLGAMFGPLGMLLGGAFGSGKPQEMFSGFVSGEKGVDKIPAMLSDGEFVMSAGAVQKYGVDTFEAMNAAGGGDNRPKIMGGKTYAAGGGYMGDYMREQVKMRPASIDEMTGRSYKLQDLLGVRNQEEVARLVRLAGNKVPDVESLIGKNDFLRYKVGEIGRGAEGADEKIFKGLQRIYQQHFGAGPEFEKMMSNRVDARVLERSTKPTSTPRPKPQSRFRPGDFRRLSSLQNRFNYDALRGQSSPLSPDYFLRGQSSPLIRQPIPASRAIVPYTGGGNPIQQIYTNMNVPGGPTSALSTKVRPRGYGGALQAAFAAMEFADRKQQGQTNAQAGLGAAGSALGGQVGWMAGAKAGALLGGAIGAMFGGVGAAPGAAVGAIIGGVAGGFGGASLGGKLADDVSGVNAAKEKLSRGGIGGAVKGGFGLKKETPKDEFKNAPNTMVMTDPQTGRPFVGHKAMKGGKLTYVRPPKPGTGTRNPLEMIGRAINPGAYADNDARVAMKDQRIAMVNALERFQAQGMAPDAQARMMKQMGGNLKDVQNDLNYRIKTRVSDQSQRRLNMLSSRGAGPKTGRGQRYTAEARAQTREDIKRGGTWGQITRGLTRMFSDPNSKMGRERIARLDAADKASSARVKQAGAASINRYYSSSDGKYYKDYDAAVRARKARLAAQQSKKPAVKPPPKPAAKPRPRYNPVGGGMNGGRGSGASPGRTQRAPSVSPRHRAGTGTTQRTTGTKR